MTTTYSSKSRQISAGDALKYGIMAGLGGGLIFGIMMAMMSLIGHIIFGLITGGLFAWLSQSSWVRIHSRAVRD